MSLVPSLLAVPLLIALNAFFVAAEYALVAIRDVQIEALRIRGYRRAARAMAALKGDPAGSIGAIQVCITMTNLLLGWIGEPAMSALLILLFGRLAAFVPEALFTGVSIGLSFMVVTLLTVVLSELLPKALTLRYVQPVAILTAAPILLIRRAVTPLVWLMNGIANLVTRPLGLGSVQEMEKEAYTAEEIVHLTTQAAADGVVTPRERSVILNALSMGRRNARQIMVPRMRVEYLDLQRSMEENRRVMDAHLHSRLPLCNGGMDHVVGVVHTKEFLSAYNSAADSSVLSLIAREPVFVPEKISLDRLLALLLEKRTEIVFLVDEYGGIEGIVTLKDVVDELVGEVKEELAGAERLPSTVAAAATQAEEPLVISGDTPIVDVARRINRPEWCADSPLVTVGGLIVAHLNLVPPPGTDIEADGVRLRVLKSDSRAVRQVQVLPQPIATADQPTGDKAECKMRNDEFRIA